GLCHLEWLPSPFGAAVAVGLLPAHCDWTNRTTSLGGRVFSHVAGQLGLESEHLIREQRRARKSMVWVLNYRLR
ncbi:MAG TPA: hypothetical protein VGJ84_19085, partial [Polyangiaceae bacterium]